LLLIIDQAHLLTHFVELQMMKRAWFYHRTAGWEKRGVLCRPCRVDFFWIDRGEYFRITLLSHE
jgi:hypothetical protein